jgi:hypothetical protein
MSVSATDPDSGLAHLETLRERNVAFPTPFRDKNLPNARFLVRSGRAAVPAVARETLASPSGSRE